MSIHGGNLRELARRSGRPLNELLDFSASINPLGPPEGLRSALVGAIDRLEHYPDPDAAELVALLAARHRVPAGQIVAGNGSSEILFALARACDYRRAIVPVPSYLDYTTAVETAGRPVEQFPLHEADDFAVDWPRLERMLAPGDLVVLGQPNNPTGRLLDRAMLREVAGRHAKALFLIDEAFADFAPGYRSMIEGLPSNVIVLHSLTKFYAVPGLRLGYAVAKADIAAAIRRQIPPWSVNTLAQAATACLLGDEDYAQRTVKLVAVERDWLTAALGNVPGLHVYPAAANYLLVRIDRPDLTAAALADRLLAAGIAIRAFHPREHLDGRFFRVAVRSRAENERLVAVIAEFIISPPPQVGEGLRRSRRVRAASLASSCEPASGRLPALMIQGTSSNAGKSVLVAALCRIMLQDGVRVAPFKAQNMSLNSFVTCDGGEMGRAQVVQAQACRLEPDVRMNPVLLKPNSDTGCQVIVRGQPVGNMRVAEYVAYKTEAWQAVCRSYDELAAGYDAIVLEGAGSPGEVNLKSHDIVNMRMADYARSPVLVVGDIDRGGVFASFVGTMEVLASWERKLVAGWLVNRFRGDASLLEPALDYTLRHTGRPVLGVVPYLADLNLPQEDSVEFKSGAMDTPAAGRAEVEIAVIDLPHISNFTDFDALRIEPNVRVRIVRSAAELDGPDAVILPGSKNTLADLAYLRRSGLAERITAIARQGTTEIVGICGGYQMLGRRIGDPLGVESTEAAADGLGLLDVDTELGGEKTLVRTGARHEPSGLDVVGYEIHHGQTSLGSGVPLLRRSDGQVVGSGCPQHRVWGTYLHGIFDADPFRRWFLDGLRTHRGLKPVGQVVARYDIEAALDRLAEVVRRSVRMDEIYRIMGLRA